MVAGFKSEWWPRSNRNAWPRCVGIRTLPRWSGCHTLASSEVFLMNPTVPNSLDGRYFGPLPTTAIVARAVPLWTDEAGDGRFVWRAATD